MSNNASGSTNGQVLFFFFKAEDGIRDLVRSRGLGNLYKRQAVKNGVNRSDQVASWSAAGPTAFDQRVKPDLVAPGALGVVSTRSAQSFDSVYQNNTFYTLMQGTSMLFPLNTSEVAQ